MVRRGRVRSDPEEPHAEDGDARYWRDVLRHSRSPVNLQAVLDEHLHVLRDWLGYLKIGTMTRAASPSPATHAMGESLGGGPGSAHIVCTGWTSRSGS